MTNTQKIDNNGNHDVRSYLTTGKTPTLPVMTEGIPPVLKQMNDYEALQIDPSFFDDMDNTKRERLESQISLLCFHYYDQKKDLVNREKNTDLNNTEEEKKDLDNRRAELCLLRILEAAKNLLGQARPENTDQASKTDRAKKTGLEEKLDFLEKLGKLKESLDKRYPDGKIHLQNQIFYNNAIYICLGSQSCYAINYREGVGAKIADLASESFVHRHFALRLLADIFFIPLGIASLGAAFALKHYTTGSATFLGAKTHREEQLKEILPEAKKLGEP